MRQLNPVTHVTPPESITANEDTPLENIAVSVVDEDSESLTINVSASNGLVRLDGESADSITRTGTADELNLMLASLGYLPPENF